ncbi:TPA: plasmid pRiA4b ORF-3 family protein [Legionella pneumophila]|nr:plasmid pRiA4b ORF-3 family protein [Legionella pneumophila]
MNQHVEIQKPTDEVYQLRIWIKGVSPMIWRRLLVRGDSTIADLHFMIQIAFGWSDTYLNQFVINGKLYGVYHDGGISFSDNPEKVHLNDFQFRINEKFTYEYNFFNHWEHEIRVEKCLPVEAKKAYPCCIGGHRAAPIEDCGGAIAFMKLVEHYSPWRLEEIILKSVCHYQQGKLDRGALQEKFESLKYWVNRHQCNRLRINDRLRRYAMGEDVYDLIWEGAYDEN